MKKIKISEEYSKTPGPRYIKEGNYSGEDFRENKLKPLFEEAVNNNETIEIDLDGGYGYPPSFLEEAFGGLARQYGETIVESTFKFISSDEPSLVDEIKNYIKKAKKQRKIGDDNAD